MVGKAEYLAKCECDLERHQETIEKLELMDFISEFLDEHWNCGIL